MQDLYPLGEEARINFPSTLSTMNWSWRLSMDQFKSRKNEISTRLKNYVEKYNRY